MQLLVYTGNDSAAGHTNTSLVTGEDFLRLQRNVFGNRFRRIAAVVRLVLLFEGAPAP